MHVFLKTENGPSLTYFFTFFEKVGQVGGVYPPHTPPVCTHYLVCVYTLTPETGAKSHISVRYVHTCVHIHVDMYVHSTYMSTCRRGPTPSSYHPGNMYLCTCCRHHMRVSVQQVLPPTWQHQTYNARVSCSYVVVLHTTTRLHMSHSVIYTVT